MNDYPKLVAWIDAQLNTINIIQPSTKTPDQWLSRTNLLFQKFASEIPKITDKAAAKNQAWVFNRMEQRYTEIISALMLELPSLKPKNKKSNDSGSAT